MNDIDYGKRARARVKVKMKILYGYKINVLGIIYSYLKVRY